MAVNTKKYKFMIVGNNNSETISNVVIRIGDPQLEQINQIRYFGIVADNRLN